MFLVDGAREGTIGIRIQNCQSWTTRILASAACQEQNLGSKQEAHWLGQAGWQFPYCILFIQSTHQANDSQQGKMHIISCVSQPFGRDEIWVSEAFLANSPITVRSAF